MGDFYRQTQDEVLKEFKTVIAEGLSEKEAEERLLSCGKNELIEKKRKSLLQILFNQIKEVMVLILIVAAIVSIFLGEYVDGAVIFVIVVLNTILGFWQEVKAENAMAALKKLSVPFVRVRRDGTIREIAASGLVPGDIVIVETGNIVPADARLISSPHLRVRESTLTGESVPVEKHTDPLPGRAPIGDRKNMIYMGTIVTYGRGEAVVTATGMNTELGKIATMLGDVEEEQTPLQKRLARLGGVLAASALVLVIIVSAISLLRGEDRLTMFMTSISMAVAAIPEGLPAVVTIALALGARSMLKKKSLIRNLPSVETLGSVTVICSDKTGTLTQNRMTVTGIVVREQTYSIEEAVTKEKEGGGTTVSLFLAGGILCNDAVLAAGIGNGEDSEAENAGLIGDPTEGALIAAAAKIGLDKKELEHDLPRVAELPFDSGRKRMTTVHVPADELSEKTRRLIGLCPDYKKGMYIAFTKGSVDGLMQISKKAVRDGSIEELSDDARRNILLENERMAKNGIRVLGVACRMLDRTSFDRPDRYEEDLVFIGMAGMLDPVRPEAAEAVALCRRAGIRPVMITGDHPLTALHIARQLGITDADSCVTGEELSSMNFIDLEHVVGEVSVYARVSPEHKMKLIDALQSAHHIVAMTGDGVNDAPALKSADIGVSMGITGTDVAKQSSDMVLLDDNFATLVSAVKEGRTIYDNIKKFITYILTGNFGEILVMLFGPLLGMPLPLVPTQILWINLVTDGAPAIALGYERTEKDTMRRPPYGPDESLFARGVGARILWAGGLIAFLSLAAGYFFFLRGSDVDTWRTVVFTTLTFCQMMYVMAVRSFKESVFRLNPLSNPVLLLSVLSTIGLQMMLVYVPFFQEIFRTAPLSWFQLFVCCAAGLIVVAAVELEKLFLRYIQKKMNR
ncbi:MAG: cation-translocating P-type ATPase [Spirochaetales bacterium]|nr:cation-translocating P-type ATPase [Spirochaetales bacterium]